MELKAGEISLHHGSLFHASGVNRTSTRRIGLALRFVTPEMKQVAGAVDYATLVRGEDRFGHFRPEPGTRVRLRSGEAWCYRRHAAGQERLLLRRCRGKGSRYRFTADSPDRTGGPAASRPMIIQQEVHMSFAGTFESGRRP